MERIGKSSGIREWKQKLEQVCFSKKPEENCKNIYLKGTGTFMTQLVHKTSYLAPVIVTIAPSELWDGERISD